MGEAHRCRGRQGRLCPRCGRCPPTSRAFGATYHRAMPPAAPRRRRSTLRTVLLTALATGALVLLALNFTAGEKKVKQQLPRLYSTAHPQFERALGSLLGPGIVGGNAVT